MENCEDAFLDGLVAARRVQHAGSAKMVTIPGMSELSHEQKAKVVRRLYELEEQPKQSLAVDADALRAALESIQIPSTTMGELDQGISGISTPDYPDESWDEDNKKAEINARELLKSYGCPPCYPPSVQFPFELPFPEEHQNIMQYYYRTAILPSGRQIQLPALSRQCQDWEDFLRRSRISLQRNGMRSFQNAIRRRRIARGVFRAGDERMEHLRQDQTRFQNWIEFQDFHLRNHETAEAEISKIGSKLAQLKAEGKPDPNGTLAYRLKHDGIALERHKLLIDWIDQQTPVMEAAAQADAQTGFKPRATVASPPPEPDPNFLGRRSPPAVVPDSPPPVPKPMELRRSTRRRRPSVPPPSAAPKRRPTRQPQKQRPRQVARDVSGGFETRTRSGRVSRKPQRWIPDPW